MGILINIFDKVSVSLLLNNITQEDIKSSDPNNIQATFDISKEL